MPSRMRAFVAGVMIFGLPCALCQDDTAAPAPEAAPDAAALDAIGFVLVENMDYPDSVVEVISPVGAESATDCATQCSESDECMAATWDPEAPEADQNCVLKTIDVMDCALPDGIMDAPNMFLMVQKPEECPALTLDGQMIGAEGPMAAGPGPGPALGPEALVADGPTTLADGPAPVDPVTGAPVPMADPTAPDTTGAAGPTTAGTRGPGAPSDEAGTGAAGTLSGMAAAAAVVALGMFCM